VRFPAHSAADGGGLPSATLRASACLLALALFLAPAPFAVALDGDSMGVTLNSRIFTGIPYDVALDGTLAYVALDTGLHIFDVSDPAAPAPLGHLYLPSPALDLALAGNLVYVANGESGLQVVDATDPALPFVLGSLPTEGARGVAVEGGIVYLAEASRPPDTVFGLRCVDVGDPTNPFSLGFAPLPNGAMAVAVAGTTAYVGIGSDITLPDFGLSTIDVSVPVLPTVLGFLPTGRPVHDVEILGNTAYLGTGFSFAGMFITADVSTPSAPATLSRFSLADAAQGVSVVFDTAYVAGRSLGLLVFDVSDPALPTPQDGLPTGRTTWGVAARGDVAFLAERSSIGQAALTTAGTPAPPAPVSEVAYYPYAEATDAAAMPGLALLLRRNALHIMDASDPAALAPLSTWAPPGADLSAVGADFPLAAVAEGNMVRLLDLSDPAFPVVRGVARVSSGVAVDVVLDGPTLHIVNGWGFEVFDVSDPDLPSALGTYATGAGTASALAVEGGRAYLTAGSSLEVVDISSLSSPALMGVLPLPAQLYGVAVSGNLAVVTGLDNYVTTVDVSSPSNPALLGDLTGGTGFGVILFGDNALVAADGDGLVIIDVSMPSAPTVAGFYDASGTAAALANDGRTVYLATVAAQHWVLGCDACAQGCLIDLDVDSPDPDVCEGQPVLLLGNVRNQSGCPGGILDFQWFEDGVPIPGATQPGHTVLGTHPPGDFVFRLDAWCRADPSCADRAWIDVGITPEIWPVIAPNSVRVTKHDLEHTIWWTNLSGWGEANVHFSLVAADLAPDPPDMSTFLAASPGGRYTTIRILPPGGIAYYRVYPRKSCSGQSAPN